MGYNCHTFTQMKVLETRTGLAKKFGWHRDTLAKRLQAIGITHSGLLTPLDLELIANKIGTPEKQRVMVQQFLK